jgi:hypothetical protein
MNPGPLVPEEPEPPERNPDAAKTLLKAIGVIVMFAIALTGLIFTAHELWTLPPKP